MPADPKLSAGARAERKAFRAFLRRYLKGIQNPFRLAVAEEILEWVLARQERYDKQPGGLGRK